MHHLFVPGDQDDKTLIADALAGSTRSLELLLGRHYTFIYNVALRFVLNPDDAQDLTQEAVIKVITKLAQFNHQAQFRTWLYRIVFNHFVHSKRRKMEQAVVSFEAYGQALDGITDIELSPAEAWAMREQITDAKIGCMTGMLLCLSREQRLVYVLGEIFGIDSRVGGTLLEMSADNYRQVLSRARKDLHSFMHRKCGLVHKANPCRCPTKTKGFVQAGWVNAQNLQFNNHYVQHITAIAPQKAADCDDLLDQQYAALFKEHPYYDRQQVSELLGRLTADPNFKQIFGF